ncbi:uncharacterized protein LOC135212926 [Macrobrachium nipponense]|uniref:uncharacterized protein LOC135212926 n=1 Tax=Macrobrachium nipponense TaxID=159736 RepID=UPI0030C8A6E7
MMASSPPTSPSAPSAHSLYSTEEKNLIRLGSIHKKVATKVLHFVFEKGSSARLHNVSLMEFYRSQGIDDTKFLKKLYEAQKITIISDDQGHSFDITLLYYCLRNGSHGLAETEHENWRNKDQASIESLLTIIKNKRNKLAHEQPSYTNEQLIREATELKEQLIKILKFSGQLYNVPEAVVNKEISFVESSIKRYLYEDFEPRSFEEYKNQLFFEAQIDYVNDEGVKDVLEQYDKIFEDRVSTVNHLAKISLPLDDIYTELKLKGQLKTGQEAPTTYNDILSDTHQKENSVIVISGPAGTGKTTLTKKVIRDWRTKQSTMQHLTSHAHLLKAQMRNTALRSFDDLLHHLMPTVSKDFKSGDLKKVLLRQKILVILDGLDELNNSSAKLFDELLYLKESFGFTLMITTRPEKMRYIEKKLLGHDIKMKHLLLIGIPSQKKYEFVKKYHSEISKLVPDGRNIEELLNYLKKTEHRLEDLWRVPYNLALLTILWVYGHVDVTNINTAPKLYTEILKLQKLKLKERLRSNETTQSLEEEDLDKRIENFLYSLGKEAIIGLKNDHINLPPESYERLEKVSSINAVPSQEMIGAFLQRVPGSEVIYSFPHKGLQDYLSALYIWMELMGKDHNYDIEDIQKCINELLLQKKVLPDASKDICDFTKERLESSMSKDQIGFTAKTLGYIIPKYRASSIIHRMFAELHGSSNYDLPKFHNVFICLIGMFSLEKQEIKERNKLEALNFLQESGVRDKESWISILNSVECDNYVASFICKQPKILGNAIKITDSSLYAYMSLMKALKRPRKDIGNVKVDIEVKGDLNGSHSLLKLIHSCHFKLRKILITENNIDDYTTMLRNLEMDHSNKSEVDVDVCIDGDLLRTTEVVKQIKEKNFVIRTLKVRDFEIDNSNASKYIAAFRSFPSLQQDAVQTTLNLNIDGDFAESGELLQLITHLHMRIGRLLINESNLSKYGAVLNTFKDPPKCVNNCEVELLCPNTDIFELGNTLNDIKKNKCYIRKLQVKDLKIDDDNLAECILLLRNLSPVCKTLLDSNVGVNLCMKTDMENLHGLMTLVNYFHFKVRSIIITNQNFLKYVSFVQDLMISEEDAQYVKVDFEDKVNLLEYRDLLKQIKNKGFAVGKIKLVDDVTICDNNAQEYSDVITSLPEFEEVASEGKIYLSMKRDLIETKDLLKMVSKKHFLTGHLVLKDGAISITEDKVQEYLEIFSYLSKIDEVSSTASLGRIDVDVKSNVAGCKALLKLIRDMNFHIRTLRMNEENISITNSNLESYAEFFSVLPKLEEGAFEGKINIKVNKSVKDVKGFLEMISDRGMVVGNLETNDRTITITDDNEGESMELLTSLPKLERGAFRANVDINLSKSLDAIQGLLKLIHEKQPTITKLEYIRKDISINDDSLKLYCNFFASLPDFMEGSFTERIRVIIENGNSDPTPLLNEVSRLRMDVDLEMSCNFQRPGTFTDATVNAINEVFQTCQVTSYTGQLDNIATVPTSLRNLHASIGDHNAFRPLKQAVLSGKHQLRNLSLSIESIAAVSKHLLVPINVGILSYPSLFLPDLEVGTRKKGCEIAKSLVPTDSGELGTVFFPRCRDDPTELILQLKESGVRVHFSIVLPTSLAPTSPQDRVTLANLYREEIGSAEGISWGRPDWSEAGSIFDVDTW